MAKPPVAPPAGDDAEMTDEPMDAGAAPPAGDDAMMGDEPDHQVLLTVCKEPDGTYRLIQGDEEDADAGGEASDDAVGATDEDTGTVFDSKGALLKGILDILNEDESAAGGGEGSDEDNFQSGFTGGEAAPGAPPAPVPQKY